MKATRVKTAPRAPRPLSTVVFRLNGVEIRADGASRDECLAQLLAGAAEADRLMGKGE